MVYPSVTSGSNRNIISSLSPYRRPKEELKLIARNSIHFSKPNRMKVKARDYNRMSFNDMVQDVTESAS